MSFLKAEWRKLAFANYAIDPKILESYIPYGTELDFWNKTCYVSLIGFMFVNTKVLGVKIPFHVNFEEVNLRFYVKRFENNEWKRGVVFIKEIVPKPIITFVANTLYKEHYQTMKMKHKWEDTANEKQVEYHWKTNSHWQSFTIKADKNESEIPLNSETEFITEHYWGYAKYSVTKTNEYEVTHPKWNQYRVIGYKINVDYGAVYGQDFDFLTSLKPDSVMLAEGSEITVESKRSIKN
ncbi:YqjF family protein [Lacinutrix jangbogonensis]|uniref:YqjF family protein n=1 Tax=Lacinutrix jangbogonensis TaxID=1469557 RepID=UPI00053D2FC0|nr:DUF2071 domain-containing protein [Lacinutrix jangbogonensis]